MPAVTLRHVSKHYPAARRGEPEVLAVDAVDLEIREGEIFGIIGYSGAGKSTLVRLINALETVTSGSLEVHGQDITLFSQKQLRELRAGIGMIFQQFNLFSGRTVWRNIEYPLQVAGVPTAERNQRISDLLHFVGLADKAAAYPDQLSGGQKQRVGIARALATSPSILLADEATSALDPETTLEVLALLKRVNKEFGTTIVVITHEMNVIKTIADRVAVMESGRIIEQGPVFDVFSEPRTETSKRFVSTVVRAVPDTEELAQLRTVHPGRIITLSFKNGNVSQSAVFLEFGRRELPFEIIYGGIDDIQGRTFGHLTLAVGGEDVVIDATLDAIRGTVDVTEVR